MEKLHILCSLIRKVKVHFHWILDREQQAGRTRELIELEYRLRPRITRYIMDCLGFECCEDFSCFHFEVDMEMREVRISDKTPEHYARMLRVNFREEIGANCC